MLGQSNCISVCLLLFGLINILVSGEFYSSIDSMELFGETEKILVDATHQYLTEQKQQIELLSSFLERVKREHVFARELHEQDEDIMEQPLLAFRLVNRLYVDWKTLNELLTLKEAKTDFRETMEQMSSAKVLPDQGDLQGAVKGLMILQRLYNLTAVDLADGYLNDVHTGNAMLWRDCYEIGVQLFQLMEFGSALDWFLVSANLLDEAEGKNVPKLKADVYEYLALTYIELGEKELAQEKLNKLLEYDPAHPAQHVQAHLNQRTPKCPPKFEVTDLFTNYTRLCQGKRAPETDDSQSSLHCYLDNKRHALFKLSPLKVEQLHLNPDIDIYYDVLNDAQINAVLDEAGEHESFRSSISGTKVSDIRVSQQVWLNYSTPILQSVSNIVGAISGFNMINAELMQIANYGVGGQYAPHMDYLQSLPQDYIERGNRIATNMIYLSDVPQGGNTIFPKLNVFVKPVKGAMVKWHNLLRSLRNDIRTMHAGCPVLEGSKRIGNIWIHSAHQEFRRPCLLSCNE